MRTIAGRYLLEGRLGAGGMGEVYRVRHLELGKSFALKVIAPMYATDAETRAMFQREVRLASELTHPNIVSVVDYGEDPELGAFMVMELVHGEPLLGAEHSGLTPIKRALDLLAQVADALEHIHRRGIVHGDIKADNIMLVEEADVGTGSRRRREVRLLDFGLSRRLGAKENQLSGSPEYLAPERALGGPASVATDIYALGILGFLLFTNTLPFDGPVLDVLAAQVDRAPPTLAERRGEAIDPAIEQLIARAIAKDPTARHHSAAAFRYEVNTVMDMLDLGRRRSRAVGTQRPDNTDAELALAFHQSPFPQALVTVEGLIVLANRAFARVAGIQGDPVGHWLAETAIAAAMPSLLRTVERTPLVGRSVERRAVLPSGIELVLWSGPTASPDRVQLVIRVTSRSPVHGHRDSAELLG